eukprot:gb/GECH01011412.1/.p1 GENE.gb/GECH01011412.1/~~gb/GECH01011412.1/.p1  ORF type:complete len:223 (+),score=54.70 gb/GECH01011412.1/:1-669(+)
MSGYKLIIMGPGGVGKSALTLQYTQGSFFERYDPTIEDSYRKVADIDGSARMLDIIDTAGQEQFQSLRYNYMRSGQGFLLVYSITDPGSFDEVSELHKLIVENRQEVEPIEPPVVLVGNKSDLEEERAVTYEEGKELSDEWNRSDFLETSAKERVNVDEAFESLVRQIIKSDGTEDKPENKEEEKTDSNNQNDKTQEPTGTEEEKSPKKPTKEKKFKLCTLL